MPKSITSHAAANFNQKKKSAVGNQEQALK